MQRLDHIETRIRELEVANRGTWSELDRQKRARRALERKLASHLENTVRMPTEDEMADLFNQIPRP